MNASAQSLEDLLSDARPAVHFAHAMDARPDADIVLRAGGDPLLVEQPVGEGKLMVFLGTAFGPDTADAFWNWERWPQLLERILTQ